MGAAQTSLGGWMDDQNVVEYYSGLKKEGNSDNAKTMMKTYDLSVLKEISQ